MHIYPCSSSSDHNIALERHDAFERIGPQYQHAHTSCLHTHSPFISRTYTCPVCPRPHTPPSFHTPSLALALHIYISLLEYIFSLHTYTHLLPSAFSLYLSSSLFIHKLPNPTPKKTWAQRRTRFLPNENCFKKMSSVVYAHLRANNLQQNMRMVGFPYIFVWNRNRWLFSKTLIVRTHIRTGFHMLANEMYQRELGRHKHFQARRVKTCTRRI